MLSDIVTLHYFIAFKLVTTTTF